MLSIFIPIGKGLIIREQCLPQNIRAMLLNPCRTLDIEASRVPDFDISYNMRMVVKAMIEQTKEIKRKYVSIS